MKTNEMNEIINSAMYIDDMRIVLLMWIIALVVCFSCIFAFDNHIIMMNNNCICCNDCTDDNVYCVDGSVCTYCTNDVK